MSFNNQHCNSSKPWHFQSISYAFPIWSSQAHCEVGIINILLVRKLMLRGTWDLAPVFQGPQAGPDDLHMQPKLLITHLSSHCRGETQNSWWKDGLGKHWEGWLGKTPRKPHRTLAGWTSLILLGIAPWSLKVWPLITLQSLYFLLFLFLKLPAPWSLAILNCYSSVLMEKIILSLLSCLLQEVCPDPQNGGSCSEFQ